MSTFINQRASVVLLALTLGTGGAAWGQTVFNVASGNWNVAGNWTSGLPGAGGAVIGWNGPGVANANVTLDTAAGTVGFLQIGRLSTGVGVLNMNAGASLTLSGDLMLSAFEQDASSTLVMAAGTTLTAGGITVVGKDGAGQTSNASFTINGGSFTANNTFYLDRSSGSTQATFTITDGTASFADVQMHENSANGIFSLQGGTVSLSNIWYTTPAATTSLTGGELNLTDYRTFHTGPNNGTLTNNGTAISPGTSTNAIGNFNLYGNYDQNSGALEFDVNSAASYDVLTMQSSGLVNIDGGYLVLDLNYAPTLGDTLTLIVNNDAEAITGTGFLNAINGGFGYAVYNSMNYYFSINYAGGTGNNDLVLTAVAEQPNATLLDFPPPPVIPEPTSLATILAGSMLLASRHRRA